MDIRKLQMSPLLETFAICHLDPDSVVPAWGASGLFFSITRTPEELSVICPEANVSELVRANRGWRCLKVDTPMNFNEIGIVASLAVPLAEAGLSIFVVSSYETDYLLIKGKDFDAAVKALTAAGHEILK